MYDLILRLKLSSAVDMHQAVSALYLSIYAAMAAASSV
jgi:hypothetical protein